jgi:uncharacterized membrane protein YhaH (DUF805 family)
MNFVNLFISPSGRINRAQFWIAIMVFAAACLLVGGLSFAIGYSPTMNALGWIVSLLVAASGVLVCMKRLHDRNKTGWWVLLFYSAPVTLLLVAALVGGATETLLLLLLLQLVCLGISIWALVELGCLRGTIGQNKYGPDPLAPDVLTPPVRTHA